MDNYLLLHTNIANDNIDITITVPLMKNLKMDIWLENGGWLQILMLLCAEYSLVTLQQRIRFHVNMRVLRIAHHTNHHHTDSGWTNTLSGGPWDSMLKGGLFIHYSARNVTNYSSVRLGSTNNSFTVSLENQFFHNQ